MIVRGFTLTELLVVIVIIAMLIGMLMPAVALVRSSAKSTDCMNRFHQMGLAFEVYLNDNEGIYPPANDWYGFGGYTNYVLGIFQSIAPTDGTAKMFMCSEDKHKPTDIVPAGNYGAGLQVWTGSGQSHGYNSECIGGKGNITTPHNYKTPALRSEIRNPTETILSADTISPSSGSYLGLDYGYAQATYRNVYPRHRINTVCNILWIDGHVSGVAAAGPYDRASLTDPLRLGIFPGALINTWDRD